MAGGSGVTLGFLKFVLGFDSLSFESGVDRASKKMKDAQKSIESTATKIGNVGKVMSVAITAPLLALAGAGVKEAQETAQAMAQVNAALTSMGNGAGRTSEQLKDFADQLELGSLFEADEILRKVTANMLTFGNIAGDNFDRAQKAAVDLATRMNTDLQSATVMLGKALNDPIKGLGALRKVGIQFTADQQAQIKAMAAVGNTAGAQAIMLKELERQFGGSAQAAQNTDPLNKANDAYKQFAETIGTAVLPILPKVADALVTLLGAFNNLSPGTQQFVLIAAGVAAAMGPILLVVSGLVSAFGTLLPVLAPLGSAMLGAAAGETAMAAGGVALSTALLPIIAIVAAVAAAVGAAYLVWKNWDSIAPVLQDFGAAVQEAFGPVILGFINTVKDALTSLWTGGFGEGIRTAIQFIKDFASAFGEAFGPYIKGILSAFSTVFEGVLQALGGALKIIVGLLNGDFTQVWAGVKDIVVGATKAIVGAIAAMAQLAIASISGLVSGIYNAMINRLGKIWDAVKNKVKEAGQWFHDLLYDPVVGHSYVPDMVDEIGREMDRLQPNMVDKAKSAAKATADQFKNLKSELAGLMDNLFPEIGQAKEFANKSGLIAQGVKRGVISEGTASEAYRRLGTSSGLEDSPIQVLEDGAAPLTGMMDKATEAAERFANEFEVPVKASALEVVQSFTDMASGAINSLQGMIRAFKSGDILGGIKGILDLVSQVASIVGAITGKGTGAGGGFGGFRAFGGPVSSGKTYMVGERGPEFFTPGTSGYITPGKGNSASVTRVQVIPSPYFDTVVDERAQAVAQPLASQASMNGAIGGARSMDQRARRVIP